VAYLPTCGFKKFHPVGFARPGRITSRARARYQGRSLSARGLLRSHREDRRAHGLARLQVAMRTLRSAGFFKLRDRVMSEVIAAVRHDCGATGTDALHHAQTSAVLDYARTLPQGDRPGP